MPPPITTTRPGATPGTPPSRMPRPPSGFSRKYAPACAARRPAISLIGASSGSRRSSVSTVSYATPVLPLGRLLDLQEELRVRPDILDRRELGAGGGVRVVGERAAETRTRLHRH